MQYTDKAAYLKQLEVGPMANFVYLIGDPATHEAAAVDPAWDTQRIWEVADTDGYKIKHILLTHGHPDHIGGAAELATKTGAPVYLHDADANWLGISKEKVRPLHDGEVLKLGKTEITCLHTPGHTPGSICFLVDSHLVSGDTLFVDACGRTDLPGGDAKQLYESLAKIKRLDEAVILCPGHNYGERKTTTMGEQKKHNPFLRASSLPDFLRLFGA